MFNLKQIIKFAKTNSFCNAFNLMKKRAATKEEEEFYRLHPEMRETPGSQPIIPEEDGSLEDSSSQIPGQQDPGQPVAVIDSMPIGSKMDEWIKSNIDEISRENEIELPDLIKKQNTDPDDFLLAPDPTLYKALLQDRNLQNILVNKLKSTGVEIEEKAKLFVEVMMMKTERIQGDMVNVELKEKVISDAEKQKQEEERIKIEERRKKDQYYKPPVLQDMPKQESWVNAGTAVSELPAWKRRELFGIGTKKTKGITRTEEMLADAIRKKLGPPSDGMLDQRMNFFLQYPDHLKPFLDQDLSTTILQELSKLNIIKPDIMSALNIASQKTSRAAKSKVCNILSIKKGALLLDSLNKLAKVLDPSIINWINRGFDQDAVEVSTDAENSEGNSMSGNLGGETSSDAGEYQSSVADMQDVQSKLSLLSVDYIQPTAIAVDQILEENIVPIFSESASRYKELISRLDPKSENLPNNKGENEAIQRELKNIRNDFTRAEIIRSFGLYSTNQLKDIFNEQGKYSVKNNSYYYTNRFGTVQIPIKVMRNIFSSEEAGDYGNLKTNKQYIEDYRSKVEDPFAPIWNNMVNYKVPYEAQADLGDLFYFVKEHYKGPGSLDGLRKKIESNEKIRNIVFQMCGIKYGSPDSDTIPIINSFIEMTANQNENDVGVKKILQVHESRMKANKEKEQASKIENKEEREAALLAIKASEKSAYHNLKSKIGYYWFPFLYQIYQASQETKLDGNLLFRKEDIRACIDLFDSYPTSLRNFFGVGSTENEFDDQGRTNTELYFAARNEPIPENIKSLLAIKIDGRLERRKTGLTADYKKLDWHKNFWAIHKEFGVVEREIEETKNRISAYKKQIEYQYAYANSKANKDISDPKLFQKLLKSIGQPDRDTFFNEISKWDQVSRLPLEYYSYLGQKKTKKMITDLINLESVYSTQIKSLLKVSEDIKKKMIEELDKSGYEYDPKSLNLVSASYEKMMTKVGHLESILNRMSKFASKDISVEDIQLRIDLCRKDFYNYFQKMMI